MMEWYPCEWCEGDGGWHADSKPAYADPSRYVAALKVLREILDERHSEGAFIDGGDLRYYMQIIDEALAEIRP